MARIIISMDGGVVLGVYADTLEPMQYMVIDEEDETDPEWTVQYCSCEYLRQHGAMEPCQFLRMDHAETVQLAPSTEKPGLPMLDANGFLLVSDFSEAETESGRQIQNLENAFVCGYLEASAEISRFISRLYREKNPKAKEIYAALRPLLERQSDNYLGLCKQINDPRRYDYKDTELPEGVCNPSAAE